MTTERKALVLSIADCSRYLVGYAEQATSGTETVEVVKGEDGRAKKFASVYQAKLWLVAQGEQRAWLRMETPYDEMVGREPAKPTDMPLPLIEKLD